MVETARRYGRVYQTGTQRLSEANHVFCHRDGPHRPAGQGPHRLRPHRPLGRGRDAARLAARRSREPPKDEVDWDAWLGPVPLAALQPQLRPRRLAGPLRFPHQLHRRVGRAHVRPGPGRASDCGDTSPVEYEYVDNDSGDGMVTHFANGVKMILSRGDKYWHGSCGERFDGTEGWVAAADGYSKPDVSSPALLARLQEGGRRLHGPHRPAAEPHAQLPRLRQDPPADRGQPRGHAPLDDHRPRRQHLHVAQARPASTTRSRRSSSTTPRPTGSAPGPCASRTSI